MKKITYEMNRLLRLSTGLNQTEFCKKINISRETFNKYVYRNKEDFESKHKSIQRSIKYVEQQTRKICNVDLRAMLYTAKKIQLKTKNDKEK